MTRASTKSRPEVPKAQLRVNVPPDGKSGREVRDRLVAFASSLQIRDGAIVDFLIAVGEAVANAIEHSRTRDSIEVTAWFAGGYLFATIVDRGVGFEPDGAAPDLRLLGQLVERGRGLPIMRSCSDVFAVRSEPGHGTAVTLGHRIHDTAALDLRYGMG